MGAEFPGPFAMLLRQSRADAGLTQEELAERAQLSPKAVSSLERGIRKRPHRVTVALLCDALQLSDEGRVALERAARTEAGAVQPREPGIPTGAFLGAVPGGRIIARDVELGVIDSAIKSVDAGSGSLLLLTGEAGVGKTRLAQEAYGLARATGMQTAAGRCYEPQSSVPYFPFLEALETVYRTCPEDLRAAVPQRWPHLRALLPHSRGVENIPSSASHDDQVLIFRAVATFIEAVSERRPLGIFLDDLHWADASSLQLLHHIARQTRGCKVLLVGTCRDAETDGHQSLVSVLRDLNREGLTELVRVAPLGLQATRELISDVLGQPELSDELAPLVYQKAEGNPYFVRQIIAALVQDVDTLTPEAIRNLGVPDTIRAVVMQRLERLSPEYRDIISEAAVLGQTFDFDDLEAMTDWEEEALEGAIEDAARFGLVRETSGDAYTFDHGLTQQTLYERLPAHRRKRLHVRAGQAIAALPDWRRRTRVGAIAWHFLQGRDRELGLRWSLIAGDQAWSVSAMSEAEHHYGLAAELAQEVDNEEARAQALEGLGRLFNVQARYEESRRALDAADSLYARSSDAAGRGRVAVELGGLYFIEGRRDEGIACVQGALDRLLVNAPAGAVPPPASELYATLGQLLWPAGRREEALLATERASEMARESGDIRTEGWAEMQRALMLEGLGRRAEALAGAQAALRFVQTSGFDDLQWYSLSVLTNMYFERGDLAAAKTSIDLGLEAAQRRGDPQYAAASLAELGRYLTWVGDWDEAETRLAEAAACVSPEDPIARFVGALKARLDLWQGNVDALESDLDKIIEASEASGNLDRLTMASVLMAEYEVGQGRADRALARLERLATRPGVRADDPAYLSGLGQTYLPLGRVEEASEAVSRGIAAAEPDGLRTVLIDLRRLEGRILMSENRPVEAEAALRESIEIAREMPAPFKQAQGLVELGGLLRSTNDRDAAGACLEAAKDLFTHLGAIRAAEQVGQEQRAQLV